MFEPEIGRQMKALDALRSIYPKMTLEMASVFLCVCYHERVPLTEIAKRLSLTTLIVHRQIAALSKAFYKLDRYDEGFGLVDTDEDPENRVRKIAYLTPKGIDLKQELIRILKSQEAGKPSGKAKK